MADAVKTARSAAYLDAQATGRLPSNGISVLVIGGGVGGLMSALECWRKGCSVRIIDRMAREVLTGDGFTISPSATRTFGNWPELGAASVAAGHDPRVVVRDWATGEMLVGGAQIKDVLFVGGADRPSLPRVQRHGRPALYRVLLDQLARIGLAVEYSRDAVEYYEDEAAGKAGVVLKDGERLEADLVIAADGLRTTSWKLIAGHPVPARSSGSAVFRAAYPIEHALKDPAVAEHFKLFNDGSPLLEVWRGKGIRMFFVRTKEEMQWVLSHEDKGTADESWGSHVSFERALEVTSDVKDWPELGDRVIKTTPPGVLVDWRLMLRDPRPNWVSPGGRVVQLGDAAHTFLPSSGNGATQAIEDAVSLAECLAIAGKDNVEWATRAHNLLRFERTSCLQAFGIVNEAKASDQFQSRDGKESKLPEFGRWIYTHEPEKYATERYHDALRHLQEGTPFSNTNIPAGLVYTPWTIDTLLSDHAEGKPTVLDGDWS